LTKKEKVPIISNEIRSLARKGLKIGPEGGERANMPISWEIREGFPKRAVLKDYFLFWKLSTKE